MRHVQPEPNSGCWLWSASVNRRGYGTYHQWWREGKTSYAHRVAWELANGPIPADMTVDHRCYVPGCVNPEHLRLLTLRDNSAQKRSVRIGLCPQGHTYDTLIVTKAGHRQRRCKQCEALRMRRYRKACRAAGWVAA